MFTFNSTKLHFMEYIQHSGYLSLFLYTQALMMGFLSQPTDANNCQSQSSHPAQSHSPTRICLTSSHSQAPAYLVLIPAVMGLQRLGLVTPPGAIRILRQPDHPCGQVHDVRIRHQRRQNAGDSNTSKVNISKRPRIIARHKTHFAVVLMSP